MSWKIPVSVLVVIHTPALDVLLIERTKHPGFWQSVTGSLDSTDEPLVSAVLREVGEETGIDARSWPLRRWALVNRYRIFREWRHRYAPGTLDNTEHVFSLEVATGVPVRLAAEEHRALRWQPWREAAAACFSWSNSEAIRLLGEGRAPIVEGNPGDA